MLQEITGSLLCCRALKEENETSFKKRQILLLLPNFQHIKRRIVELDFLQSVAVILMQFRDDYISAASKNKGFIVHF